MAIVALLVLGVFGIPVVSAVSSAGALYHTVSATSSTNWAGFAVTGAKGSVSDVQGSWIVPSIQGSCPRTNQYSSFWVGIDGFNSRSVEQTGTDSDCQGGSPTYYAWYEFYPKPSVGISLSISPGDTMFAEVKHTSSGFTATIKDVTTGKSFTKSVRVSAARSSAEWIAEAPSSSSGILPLADFGTIKFGTDATGVASTCTATVSASTGAVGSFSNIHAITMVNTAGTQHKANPTALSSDRTSFNVTWVSAGP
ncbi:MAG TPA: G1 family glutamic endopeptidase [Thermoplasmata archaeon]|nr:G1 family glutamic endopeptidase [Thermoplasmata archaeon]